MKANVFTAISLLVMMVFAGCQTIEEETSLTSTKGHHTITIHATKDDPSRTIVHEDDANTFHTAWEVGDRIAICEMVKGISTDPDLFEIDDLSGFVSSNELENGGEVATFNATFENYYWQNTFTPAELATYTFEYCYVASTMPYYSIYTQQDENGDLYIPLYLFPDQTIGLNRFSTESDLMVSDFKGSYASRPEEIEFRFARLGSIVKINIGGLQEGDILYNGTWHTGDSFLPALNLEAVISYYPQKGEYKYEIPDYLSMEELRECHKINFYVDSENSIVVGPDGTADIYLRTLPGTLSDWFMLECNILRGEEMLTYSKYVSLKDAGKSLTFKDSGLTKFSVSLKEAKVDNPEQIDYIVPESGNGFIAAWKAQEHVAGYECYYTKMDAEEGVENPKMSLTPFDGATIGMAGMVCVQAEGIDPDVYLLGVRAIPDAESGPLGTGFYEKEIYVGLSKPLTWSRLQYGELTQHSATCWEVSEEGSSNVWTFDVNNVTTDWGYLIVGKQNATTAWSFGTSVEKQHIGQIDMLQLKLSSRITDLPKVHGITPAGELIEITNYTVQSYDSSYTYYNFDLKGVGYCNGFMLSNTSTYMFIENLSIYYYAPTSFSK